MFRPVRKTTRWCLHLRYRNGRQYGGASYIIPINSQADSVNVAATYPRREGTLYWHRPVFPVVLER